jgi:hypothetical protein
MTNENKQELSKDLPLNVENIDINVKLSAMKSAITRSIFFSIAAFGASLYIVYNIAALQNQQNEIYSEAKSTLLAVSPIAKGEIERKNSESIYPTNPRAIAIAGSLSLLDIKFSSAMSFLSDVSDELKQDERERQFFVNVAAVSVPTSMVEVFDTTKLKIFDRWVVDTGSSESPLLNSFPRNPILIMNHETVIFPKCNDNEEPVIVYAKAIKDGVLGSTWDAEPTILEDNYLGRWIVRFKDLEPMDKAAFDRRLLVMTQCNTIKGN